MPPVTWQESSRVQRVIRGDAKAILHLHGYWDKPESIVLGSRSYEEIIRNTPAQNLQRALGITRTLVFVGCGSGLEDPNFGQFLAWLRDNFSGSEYRHYRLAISHEDPEGIIRNASIHDKFAYLPLSHKVVIYLTGGFDRHVRRLRAQYQIGLASLVANERQKKKIAVRYGNTKC